MRTRAAIMAMMLAGAASALATAGAHAAPVGYEEPQILKIEPGGAATVQSYTPII
jgi:Spy/CpxP family protein refolding chaperone